MHTDLLTADFRKAAHDYRYLIEGGYSRKSVLKLVGDRYALASIHRTLLYRGILPKEESRRRERLLIPSSEIQELTLDGYNVIVTLANYLYGRPVFLGTDGLLRDAGDAYGRLIGGPVFERAAGMLVSFLQTRNQRYVRIFLDRPVPKSGELAMRLREDMERHSLEGTAETVRSPDYELKQVRTGAICTSDSVIIDDCHVPVCDLAREILDAVFSPQYPDLNEIFAERDSDR